MIANRNTFTQGHPVDDLEYVFFNTDECIQEDSLINGYPEDTELVSFINTSVIAIVALLSETGEDNYYV